MSCLILLFEKFKFLSSDFLFVALSMSSRVQSRYFIASNIQELFFFPFLFPGFCYFSLRTYVANDIIGCFN